MRGVNTGPIGVGHYGSHTTLCIGIVKNNADPAQHGRLQVWIPSIDSPTYEVEDLPWALYVSPFGGHTANFKAGREQDEIQGITSYGLWAIPKNGAQVLVGFLEGDPNVRFWMGCFYMPEMNRTLPSSVNGESGPMTEIDETERYPQAPISPIATNLKESGLDVGSKHYKTRGGYERSVSHPSNKNRNKPRDDGYATNPIEPDKADSQTISLTSPGRHYMVMSDVDDHCRIRIKTTAGSQIIFDDTNERIYISTAKGRNYVELDEGNGKIYIYSSSKVNIHADNDINLTSDENINIIAKKRVNIVSEERGIKLQSKMGLQFLSSGGDIKLTASRAIHLKTTNGPNAGGAGASTSASSPPYGGKALGLIRDHAEEGGSGSSSVYINGSRSVELRSDSGGILITGSSGLDLRSVGGNLNIQAGGQLNLNGATIATRGSGVLGMYAGRGTRIPVYSLQNASGASTAGASTSTSAENIKSAAVIPKHEPWDRDEDEGQAKTPRNKKYQG